MTRRDWFTRIAALLVGTAMAPSIQLSARDLDWEYSRPIHPPDHPAGCDWDAVKVAAERFGEAVRTIKPDYYRALSGRA